MSSRGLLFVLLCAAIVITNGLWLMERRADADRASTPNPLGSGATLDPPIPTPRQDPADTSGATPRTPRTTGTTPAPRVPATSPAQVADAEYATLIATTLEDARQIADASRRDRALRFLATELATQQDAGRLIPLLRTVLQLEGIDVVPYGFRGLLIDHVRHDDVRVAAAALYGLRATSPDEQDLDLALEVAARLPGGSDHRVVELIGRMTRGKLEGPSSEAISAILREAPPGAAIAALTGLPRSFQADARLQETLVHLTRSSDARLVRRTLRFGIGKMADKPVALVARVLELAEAADGDMRRAAQGALREGVAGKAGRILAAGVLERLPRFPTAADRAWALRMLGQHGDRALAPAVHRASRNADWPEALRAQLRELGAQLERR